MEDFADSITQSNIPQVKTVLTSVITAPSTGDREVVHVVRAVGDPVLLHMEL